MKNPSEGESLNELVSDSSVFSRVILGFALLSGLGSGSMALVGTQDRYHAADATKDFALRDAEIRHNAENLASLRKQFESTPHPPQRIDSTLLDHESRIRKLEDTRGMK